MLDRIERLAEISVARGCGFAAFAIALIFIGVMPGKLSFAFAVAGTTTLFACGFLIAKAGLAMRRPHNRTEVWHMLKPADRPSPQFAQILIGSVLRRTFLRFAQQAALASCLMLSCAVVGGLAGV